MQKFPHIDRLRSSSPIHLFKSVVCTEKLDGCVAYKTKVLTDQGLLPIGRIVNDRMQVQVATYKELAHTVEFKPILRWHRLEGAA